MDGWKTTHLLGGELFRGYVKLRGGYAVFLWQKVFGAMGHLLLHEKELG